MDGYRAILSGMACREALSEGLITWISLGYTPVCSSSSQQKSYIFDADRTTAPFFALNCAF